MDPDILNTIDNCLKKATHPDNIVFGICLQHEQTDDFLQKYDNNPQFRIHRMDWSEAKGPAYARGIISQLFRDEDYYFQINIIISKIILESMNRKEYFVNKIKFKKLCIFPIEPNF